ncbi:DUF6115 domain-containing protein [Sporosarcina sp. CAU 1771]
MIPIFLLALFIIQIIGFYLLALLYTKVSKFDDLEKKQRTIMEEMDDSIAAYLTELKDENDRLINRLATMEMKVEQEFTNDSTGTKKPEVHEGDTPLAFVPPKRPVNLALKSYAVSSLLNENTSIEDEPLDDRAKVLKLYETGKSVEEIAKELEKGRTEVELFLKFGKR